MKNIRTSSFIFVSNKLFPISHLCLLKIEIALSHTFYPRLVPSGIHVLQSSDQDQGQHFHPSKVPCNQHRSETSPAISSENLKSEVN